MIGNGQNSKKGNKLVAVYGTLRKSFENHHFVEKAKYLGTFTSKSRFIMICIGPYPILTPETSLSEAQIKDLSSKNINATNIVYELYELNKDHWKNVCHLEGFTGQRGNRKNEYETMDLETDHGIAEIFVQHKLAEGEFVSNGDYLVFKAKSLKL